VGLGVAVLLVVGVLVYAWFRWQGRKVVGKTGVVSPAAQEHIKDNGVTFVAHEVRESGGDGRVKDGVRAAC
jgi:hypothetical protein